MLRVHLQWLHSCLAQTCSLACITPKWSLTWALKDNVGHGSVGSNYHLCHFYMEKIDRLGNFASSSRLCNGLYIFRIIFMLGPPHAPGVGRRNVLLVVAHPDDESMFFSPTILYLTSRGHSLHLLCLSTGDADGKGSIRKEELYKACAVFKVPLQQVKIVDHPALQDGFDKTWSHHVLAKIIEEEVKEKGIDLLITFDDYGVSGHPNHCAVHHGVCMVLCGNSHRNVEAWELISTNTVRKYMGPVDIWLSILCSIYSPSGQMYCLLNGDPHESFLAMAQHRSQWVWFRKLFVLLSSYTYMNALKRINV